jgi:hypothetical protein
MKKNVTCWSVFAVALTFVLGLAVPGSWAFDKERMSTIQFTVGEEAEVDRDIAAPEEDMDRESAFDAGVSSTEPDAGTDAEEDTDAGTEE